MLKYFWVIKMSKKYLLLLSAIFLIGCDFGSASNSANSASKPSITDNSISNSNNSNNDSASSREEEKTVAINKKCDIDFSEILSYISTSYINTTRAFTEWTYENGEAEIENHALISLEEVSEQDNTIINAPVIRAVNSKYKESRYVTLLSSTPFAINKVNFAFSFWKDGDFANIGTDYYVGVEYLLDGTWTRGESVDLSNAPIGQLDELVPYTQEIDANNVTDIRLAFDFPNATGNVRLGLYSLSYEGIEYRYNEDNEITKISFKDKNASLKPNQEMDLEIFVNPIEKKEYVNFSSSDRSKAIVKDGKIIALSEGRLQIDAYNGETTDHLVLDVLDIDGDYTKILQARTEFNGSIPIGKANFESFYSGTWLNFTRTGDALETNLYPVTGPTLVKLNMAWSSNNANPAHAADNIFSVIGYDENGKEIEKVQKKGLVNVEFKDILFEFTDARIRKYKIIYEFKNQDETLRIYGKNYCLRYITIYQK